MASKIEDYALIGDMHTAALVGRDGAIDWLCFPRFDSPACFAALLGNEDNGHWTIAPTAGGSTVSRRYVGDSLVLESTWQTQTGQVRVIDFMPPRDEHCDVIRIVEGVSGAVDVRSTLRLRFDYGSIVPWVRRVDHQLGAVAGPDSVWLHSPVETQGRDFTTYSDFVVHAGQRYPFVLTWQPSHLPPPRAARPERALTDTLEYWAGWVAQCTYDGKWKDAVVRSLITLKALTYAPTGGIVAAATTSLPEGIGGVRNWDYRYCWLRDATMTLQGLLANGYVDEAADWRQWLVRAIAGDPADLQIMYGVSGERRLTEFVVDWLPGYERSHPVRVGNAAAGQFQLDVYGEVMDALHVARVCGLAGADGAWAVQRAVMEFLSANWHRPDNGLWEVRGPQRHFTHSKVMAWVAADRAVKSVRAFGLAGDAERWARLRDEIHRDVCANGYSSEVGGFVQYYGSTELDASMLLIPQVGFLPADDPRMISTIEAIQKNLMSGGFVQRYQTDGASVDGLPGPEGVFLACTFWLADALHVLGRTEEASEMFERLLALRNDVGLLSEEYDPVLARALGNTPQAFSHVPLVHTARTLSGQGHPRGFRQCVQT